MKTKEILIAGTAGTTLMTLFSYIASLSENENFSEPERLGQLAKGLSPALSKTEKRVTGWTAHYLVGLAFAAIYVELWNKEQIKLSFKNNTLLGAVSGLVAVGIWKLTFKLHPLPPRLSFNKYYLQLVPAHIIFAVFAGLGYQVMKKIKAKQKAQPNKLT